MVGQRVHTYRIATTDNFLARHGYETFWKLAKYNDTVVH